MNKNILIIGSYPNKTYKMDMLGECIDRVRPLGYDIMVVTHHPLTEEIQSKVDYVIYDKENKLVSRDLSPLYWLQTDSFTLNYKSQGHILTVCKNIVNGIKFSESLGYEFFFYMESDNLLEKEDLLKIEVIRKSMYLKNNQMVYFSYLHEECNILETLMFGGRVSYYKEINSLPLNESDLNGESVSLERLVFQIYENKLHEFYLVPISSKEFFSKSQINKEYQKYFVDIILSNDGTNLYFFFMNISNIVISTKFNDNEKEFGPMSWHLNKVNVGDEINVKVMVDGVENTRQFIVKDKMDYVENGFILFN